MVLWNKELCLTVLGSIVFTGVETTTAQTVHFKLNNDTSCRKGQLSPPWTAPSVTSCVAECKTRFQERCTNVVYNPHNRTCSGVYPKSRDDPILQADTGDVLYSLDAARHVTCDTVSGFQLQTKCGTAVCVIPSTDPASYGDATAQCQARDAVLFIPNTYGRFALLETISPLYTWGGLVKTDGVWLWDNGDTVESDFYNFIWSEGQPNHNYEECAVLAYDVFLDKLHDWTCTAQHRFVCEQN